MAKIKKRKLRWEASTSPQVVGYKLYWSAGEEVHYGSESAALGNRTEVVLPEDIESFKPGEGPVTFAITAVDEVGNESDMITLAAPYQFSAPRAPKDFWMETGSEFQTDNPAKKADEQPEPIPLFEKRLEQMEEELEAEEAKLPMMARGTVKYPQRCDSG